MRVCLIGYLGSELGISRAARNLATVIQAVVPDLELVDLGVPGRTHVALQTSAHAGETDVRLLCFNADETASLLYHPLVRQVRARYSIGVWHWEAESLPWWMRRATRMVDEIWVGSHFTHQAIYRSTRRPVHIVPPRVPHVEQLSNTDLSNLIPDQPYFLTEFDYRSVFDRKNPIGAVSAFRLAFAPNTGPILVVKTVNSDRDPESKRRLYQAIAGRPDITLLDTQLSQAENFQLISNASLYVSLHRSEGFGLALAEAQLLGTPILATAYSGPLDFLSAETSLFVGYTLREIGPGRYPYPPRSRWAEPDLELAADRMRWVWSHPDETREMSRRAMVQSKEFNRPEAIAKWVESHFDSLNFARSLPVPAGLSSRSASATSLIWNVRWMVAVAMSRIARHTIRLWNSRRFKFARAS